MRRFAFAIAIILVSIPAQAGWQDEIKALYTKCDSLSSAIRATMCGLSVAVLDLDLVQGKHEEAKIHYQEIKTKYPELF